MGQVAARIGFRVCLLREELRDVFKRLHFDGVAGRVKEKHRGLFARQPFEPNVGFDHELDAMTAQSFGQRMPFGHRQNDSEVPRWNLMIIDAAVGSDAQFLGRNVRHDLMAVEIEISPLALAHASFAAAKHVAIEAAGHRQIMHRESEVEWMEQGGVRGGGLHGFEVARRG